MKLILHIGTHKTGTTALQQFLYANRQSLANLGLHYATPGHGLQEASVIANALNVGQVRNVRKFLAAHVAHARRSGAHTILVSSENFYAMSVLAAMQRRQVCHDTLESDRALIESLKALVPDDVLATQIVCYFRRPDRYAESLYSQHVKRGIMFDGTFQELLPIIEPALRYHKHMQAWSTAFGKGNCTVRQYESVKGDIVSDFVRNVIDIDDVDQFAQAQSLANERLSRDALEFKRLRNRIARPNERDIERTILGVVDEELALRRGEPSCYQDFLSPVERAEFLSRLKPEIDALEASYGVEPFPPFDRRSAEACWSPYPGLTEQRRWELESRYGRVSKRVAFRIDRLTLRSVGFLRTNLPGVDVLFDVLKAFGAKHALRRAMRHLQLGSGW
jgi:hypothetical protein